MQIAFLRTKKEDSHEIPHDRLKGLPLGQNFCNFTRFLVGAYSLRVKLSLIY